MLISRTNSTPVVINNPPSRLPKTHNLFKHTIHHSHMTLSTALEQSDKQSHYNLGEQNSTAKYTDSSTLERIEKQSKKSVKEVFTDQIKARNSHADNRLKLVKKLHSSRNLNGSILSSFKAEASILPNPIEQDIIDTCCDKNNLTAAAKYEKTPSGCSHEEGGRIAVDLDEAAHGTFAAIKHIEDIAKGKAEEVVRSFKNDAAELSSEPVRHVGKELTEGGLAEFSSTVGAAGLLLPLAAMAVKAGIEEWQHGTHQLQQLDTLIDSQSSELRSLVVAEQALSGKPMQSRIQAQEVRLEKTLEAVQEARRTKQIGFCSAASGLTIGIKAASDIALKSSVGIKGAVTGKGFFALNESAQAGTAAAGVAVGFGLAGTLVLGPLAGLFATGLGAFFTLKTVTKLQQLKSDFELLKADMKADTMARSWRTDPDSEALHSFLVRQGEKRIGFFKQFARWNKSFMVGSGLYASSAVTKAVVTGLAIGGVAAAASNPIGLAAITVVGILGSIAMGVASLSFFRGHGKQGKYSQATAADHEWVDRRLMTDLHGIQPLSQIPPTLEAVLDRQAISPGSHPGFDMASACLNYLDKNKKLLHDFMNNAAKTTKKNSPLEKNITWLKHLRGKVLNTKEVQIFLKSDQGARQFNMIVQQSLIAKTKILIERIKQREALVNHLQIDKTSNTTALGISLYCAEVSNQISTSSVVHQINNKSETTTNTESLNKIQQLSHTLEGIDRDYARDQADLELTLLRLKNIEYSTTNDVITLASYINAGKDLKEISKFLYQGMDHEIRKARGVLFESQLEGARLHDKQYKNRGFQSERVEI